MDKKEKHNVKLSDQDMYWIQTLLRDYIEGRANLNQIEDIFPLLKKLREIKDYL